MLSCSLSQTYFFENHARPSFHDHTTGEGMLERACSASRACDEATIRNDMIRILCMSRASLFFINLARTGAIVTVVDVQAPGSWHHSKCRGDLPKMPRKNARGVCASVP